MEEASANLEYEKAAKFRDKLRSLNYIQNKRANLFQLDNGNLDLTNLTLKANNGGIININNTSATGNITLGNLVAAQSNVSTSL